jgi:hypothetical protein
MNALPKLMCPHRWSILETASSWSHRMIRSMHVIKTTRFMQKPVGRDQIGGAEPFRKSVIDRTEAGNGFSPSTQRCQRPPASLPNVFPHSRG